MLSLFRASLYKLFREKTFIITMIIGTGLAILLPAVYKLLDLASGQSMLLSSTSTGNNFGLTVPINLGVLTIAEFTSGSLRNKIIAGNKRVKIYLSLFFSGVIFMLIMMTYYVGLSVAMGTIFGGFDAEAIGGGKFIGLFLLIVFFAYFFITAFSVFIATAIRNIGGTISIVVIALVVLSLVPTIIIFNPDLNEDMIKLLSWLVPLFACNWYGVSYTIASSLASIDTLVIPGIITSVVYAVALVVLGCILFKHSDIK